MIWINTEGDVWVRMDDEVKETVDVSEVEEELADLQAEIEARKPPTDTELIELGKAFHPFHTVGTSEDERIARIERTLEEIAATVASVL